MERSWRIATRILVPDVPEHWLHQQVAMVLQHTFLFSGTLVDNIRYGRPDASDAEVAAAAGWPRLPVWKSQALQICGRSVCLISKPDVDVVRAGPM